MFLQEREQRGAEAAFGETACGAVTCRATIRKQLRCRFALIEILGLCRAADQRIKGAEDQQTAPQLWL